ncbi:MAG: 50S ribosomal protein L25 [Spirochaetaceae bacterium]|jgi:large subunit ribosomal protein L25|nr:50S ribosomal protein L25 [Spirochaetaceae bacterium]
MEQMIVKAASRKETGKVASSKLRKTGKIPAVMYNSRGESSMLVIDEGEFSKVRKLSTPTTLVNLVVDGQDVGIAFIKDTEYDIKTDKNLHADFHVIDKDKELKAKIKVQFSGTPAGVREGGRLNTRVTQVDIRCLPADLPVRIVSDISALGIGAIFRVKDLPKEKGVTILTDSEVPLLSITAAAVAAAATTATAAAPAAAT